MRVVSVVGARPQFVKLGPIAAAMKDAGVDHRIIHTGQHYDRNMSSSFFADLRISEPDVHLGIGSGGHGQQTGRMLEALDPVLSDLEPDWVLVYGDTNSTIAAALSAVKLHLKVAHLEAGLRSFNKLMPEEHNRVLTDHASDLCLSPTEFAMRNLSREGLHDRSILVGDVMTDVCLKTLDKLQSIGVASPLEEDYILATLHRAENTDDAARLRSIVHSLQSLPSKVLLAVHPRLRSRALEFGIDLESENIELREPMPYMELINAAFHAQAIVTDSGGLQKEAFLVRTPCVTVRTETEWIETVELGWNVLSSDPDNIAREINGLDPRVTNATPYGDGTAAFNTVRALSSRSRG